MANASEEFEKQIIRIASKAYHSPKGLSAPYTIYQDVHSKEHLITLEMVRKWFRENVERTKQVGGAKNSYEAQGPFQ